MSDNEKEINLVDSATSDSGLGSMNPSLNVSELGQSIQTADSNSQSVTESNITEYIIIDNAEAKSTPVVTKTKEKEWSMNDIFNLVQTMSENMVKNSDFNNKFDIVNKRFDANDEKFDRINCRFDVNDNNSIK